MIGVAKYYLGIDIILEFTLMHSFDTADSAYGHENWGGDYSVVGSYLAGTCMGVRSCGFYFEIHIGGDDVGINRFNLNANEAF